MSWAPFCIFSVFFVCIVKGHVAKPVVANGRQFRGDHALARGTLKTTIS